MLPDSCVSLDNYGCQIINVSSAHLENFPALIEWIRKKGFGRETGFVKLRLDETERQDDVCASKALELMQKVFGQKKYNKDKKCKVYSYMPDAQLFFKASIHDHIYEYVKTDCSEEERKQFVHEASNPASYDNLTENCCSQVLQTEGLEGIRRHMFETLCGLASYNERVEEQIRQTETGMEMKNQNGSALIYGAGIQVDRRKSITISGKFSLSHLKTILDLVEEKYDGLAYPYIYAGTSHSIFPWHIEDSGLFSINYLMKGASKLWFCIAPKYFGLVDKIAAGFRLDGGHKYCRAMLAQHKVLVADPLYFQQEHGVPYTTVVQEPGDFIVTLPFTLHAGGNLGSNLAIAANFADKEWIEQGLYAPVCDCFYGQQVHLNISEILKECRPDLLPLYRTATSLSHPRGHPLEVCYPPSATCSPHAEELPCAAPAATNQASKTASSKKTLVSGMKGRTLLCPECEITFTENKMGRLEQHITNKHPQNQADLLRIVRIKYPPKTPKGTSGFKCTVCSKDIRGSIYNVRSHHQKLHGDIPFQRPKKFTL